MTNATHLGMKPVRGVLSTPTRRPQRALAIATLMAALASAHCGNGTATGGGPDPSNPAVCRAPASVSASPQTVEDVTALVNALRDEHGGQLDLPCFLESLNRPLGAATSSGAFSAQPAMDAHIPRIFLWSGDLVLSVVPEGTGSPLLEMGQETTPTRSIKGEIGFPVTAPLAATAPYDRIREQDRTKCAICHAEEKPATSASGASAFESDVLRPAATEAVDLGELADESAACDPKAEPDRCALLHAVFSQGGLHTQAFSPDAKTIYGN